MATPSSRSNRRVVNVSLTKGRLSRTTSSAVNNDAAIAGSAEFFAPPIRTWPSRRWPPLIFNLSIVLGSTPAKDHSACHKRFYNVMMFVQHDDIRVRSGGQDALFLQSERLCRIRGEAGQTLVERPAGPGCEIPKRNFLRQ